MDIAIDQREVRVFVVKTAAADLSVDIAVGQAH